MTAAMIPRFLLPQGARILRFHTRPVFTVPLAVQRTLPQCRHTSKKSPPSKPIVLEKPTKFNPPSHGARLKSKAPRQYPGPPLSAQQLEDQKTQQYPHMMPPEGSFMRWFLTNRSVHVWITLGTLFSLALFTFVENFHRTCRFPELLPPPKSFFSRPFSFVAQYIEVFRLETMRTSRETAERRKKKIDDVQKKNSYRKAHGIVDEEGLGPWKPLEDRNALKHPLKVDGAVGADTDADGAGITDGGAAENTYVDWEGKRRPVKKWLGIW